MLKEKKFFESEKDFHDKVVTAEDYYLLACLSPSLTKEIMSDVEKFNVSTDFILKVYEELSNNIIDRDKEMEVNAHKFSSLTTQDILKQLSNMVGESGDENTADVLKHAAEYDVYAQAYLLDPEHLKDREKFDRIWENIYKDLSEVKSIDAVDKMLTNHYTYGFDRVSAQRLEKRSKEIFESYYLNLSPENKEELKRQSISSLKFRVLDGISNVISSQPSEDGKEQYLELTTDEIISIYDNSNKFEVGTNGFNIYRYYDNNEKSFKEAFDHFCNEGDVGTVLQLIPHKPIKEYEQHYIEKSSELIFNMPESSRNDFDVSMLIFEILHAIKRYNRDNTESGVDYTELIDKLKKEDERISKYLEYIYKNGNNDIVNLNNKPLAIPESSSASESGI